MTLYARRFPGGGVLLAKFLTLFLVLTVLGLSFSFRPAYGEEEDRSGIRMICLNVGKGDAILLSLDGRNYLVDTGYKRTWKNLKALLSRENVRRLDGVFITHPHKDHMGGLEKLLESEVRVDALYAPALSQMGNGSGHPVVAMAAQAGKHVRFLDAGDVISVSAEAYFEVLGPLTLNTQNENNNSLVMRLVSPDGSILLTGDMKAEEEASLLLAGVLSPAEVLKVPFHGKSSASSAAFLRAVRPRVSVISTSTKEEKDTPGKDVLYRLASVGSQICVTQSARTGILITLKNKKPSVRLLTDPD